MSGQSERPRRTPWKWAVAVVAAVGAVIAFLNTTWGNTSELTDRIKGLLTAWLLPENALTLRDAKAVSLLPGGSKRYALGVEAITSRSMLHGCLADLDSGFVSPTLGRQDGASTDQFDIGENGYFKVVFIVAAGDIKPSDKLRLRCREAVSDWSAIDMSGVTRD